MGRFSGNVEDLNFLAARMFFLLLADVVRFRGFRDASLRVEHCLGRNPASQRTGNLLISRAFGSRVALRIGRLDDAVLNRHDLNCHN